MRLFCLQALLDIFYYSYGTMWPVSAESVPLNTKQTNIVYYQCCFESAIDVM